MFREESPLLLGIAGAFLLAIHAIAPAAAQTTKNLVVNGSFDSSLAGWTPNAAPFVTDTWRPTDATGGPGSGTARAVLVAGHESGFVSFRQCVELNGATRYALSLRTRTSAPRPSQQVAGLTAWSGAHCDGSFLAGPLALLGGTSAAWETTHFIHT